MFDVSTIRKILPILIFILISTTADEHTMGIVGGKLCDSNFSSISIALTSWWGVPICSASLISSRWVLTAAHCWVHFTKYYASPSHLRDKYTEKGGWLSWSCPVIKIRKIFIHPHYQAKYVVNDIALMLLSEPMTDPKVSFIKLPENEDNFTDSCTLGTAVGFGMINEDNTQKAKKVQCLELGILKIDVCMNRLPSDYLQGPAKKICVDSDKSKDVCFGDSGGPLVCDGVQIGIASYIGSQYCASGKPAVFTRVDRYLDFIKWTMANYGKRIVSWKHFVISAIFLLWCVI